jgi:hypothetical protein
VKKFDVLILLLICTVLFTGPSIAAPAGKLILTLGPGAGDGWRFENLTHTSSAAVCDQAEMTDSVSSIRCWGNWIELIFHSDFSFSLKTTIVNKRHGENSCVVTVGVYCDYDKECGPSNEPKIEDKSPGYVCAQEFKPIVMFDTGPRTYHYQLGY